MWNKIILVFFGGAVGAAAREFVVLAGSTTHGHFPTAILTINLLAALLIGLVTSLAAPHGPIDADVKLFASTGILGGFSTFSTMILGTLVLLGNPGEAWVGAAYLMISLVAGLALVELGYRVGRVLLPPSSPPAPQHPGENSHDPR